MKDSADIRKVNKDKIRRILWTGGGYTKQNIAKSTRLSVATCNTLLNAMEECGEVVGSKERLQEVGRSTVVYHINEAYESILCISFEMIQGKKSLTRTVLSPIGAILDQNEKIYETLNLETIVGEVSEAFTSYPNISQIMIGTPSIAEHGRIRHCDIAELENADIVEQIASKFAVPVYMENDMHFKVYGYYKKEGAVEDVITLANFPSHILPGTATVHSGTIIKGGNQFAGMVGFLPYEMSREEQLIRLEKTTCLPLVSKAIASVITIVNPNRIIFTGDLLDEVIVKQVWEECLKTIPQEYMPMFSMAENMNGYYLEGMYQKALDKKGVKSN